MAIIARRTSGNRENAAKENENNREVDSRLHTAGVQFGVARQ